MESGADQLGLMFCMVFSSSFFKSGIDLFINRHRIVSDVVDVTRCFWVGELLVRWNRVVSAMVMITWYSRVGE